MTYKLFQKKINTIVKRADAHIKVRFSEDSEKGRFFADCSDGTRITGCSRISKITVRFGSGHQAMIAI